MAETAKDPRYQMYLDTIRRRVCAVCLDQRDDGTCRLAGGRLCAIEDHLPQVVEAILAVHSDRMDEYVAAIQSVVCRSCEYEDDRGHCGFRARGECALDTYLSLVVDAVEEVKAGESRLRSSRLL